MKILDFVKIQTYGKLEKILKKNFETKFRKEISEKGWDEPSRCQLLNSYWIMK